MDAPPALRSSRTGQEGETAEGKVLSMVLVKTLLSTNQAARSSYLVMATDPDSLVSECIRDKGTQMYIRIHIVN